MSSCDFDDGAEHKKINLLQLIEVFVAVTLIFALKVSGDNWLCFPANLFNHHVVFLVGNVIIVVCYVLSHRTEKLGIKSVERNSSSSHRKTTSDASIGESVTVTSQPTEKHTPEEESGEENYEIAGFKTESETEMEVAIKQAVKQIERFRRTQSEKLKSEILMKPQRKLKRSVAEERRRFLATSGEERSPAMSSEMVEKMSNEEFQLAIEKFISKQHKFLKLEGVAESNKNF
ncbi:hypothetical protein R6Q57_022956 [Mikania cordata]